MSAYADLLGLVNSEQDIATKQTLNQLRLVEMAKMNQQIATDAQTRKIAQAYEDQKQRANDNAAGLPVGPPVPPQGVDANPQLQAIQSQIGQAQQNYQYYAGLATALRKGGGNLSMAEKYDDNARDAMKVVQEGQLRLLQERKDAIKQVGAIAGTATEDNFDQVKQQLDTTVPGWDRKLDVDISPLAGGATVWGPRTAKAMQTLADSSLTRYQQLEDQHNQAQEALRAQSNQTQLEEIKSRDEERKSRDKARREGIALRQDRENRLAAQAAKDKVRTAATKEPTVSEVKDIADNFAQEDGLKDLTPSDRRVAARDFAKYRNQVLAKNPDMDTSQAEGEALAFVKGRVQAGTEGKRSFVNYLPFTDKYEVEPKPTRYSKGTTPAAVTTPTIGPLTLPSKQEDLVAGKVYNTSRGPATWDGEKFIKQ